ncbi:MFS transporter [Burkholderia sp. SRS-W-2-2016]|uniref:MFS transporter n=1 Tax=Burkholderia sp. SRS-W-2-2016 TaxID=1926878 RepID=UPI00094AC80B|nr:MFS transporter [Burkholderia sp. SRS-W-2-2016]OLL27525.1 MFS transporter [Burkholderia sp. SRS-W-2-2016]
MPSSLNAGKSTYHASSSSHAIEDQVYRKVGLRIMPLLFLAYLLAFLDRINVGYAQLQMKTDLGFTDAVYGLGAGIFFLAYLLFEIPSNMLLERIGARLTLLRIMVLWGITSAAMMFVRTPTHFYIVRALLGLFEGGFFPGIILYLTYWFPRGRRAAVTGQFMFAVPVAGIIGGPLSGLVMTSLNGTLGLAGWQWMFVVEGLPTVLLGVVCYFMLANRPSEARWLSDTEKAVVQRALDADADKDESVERNVLAELRKAVSDPRVWLLAFVYFSIACGNYAFTFWLPTMIKSLGVDNLAKVGLYSAIPYAFAGAGVLLISRSSDYFKERRIHIGGFLVVSALAFALTPQFQTSLSTTLAVLCFVAFFEFGASISFWSIPPTYLRKETVAVGLALVSSIGVIGGFVSPTVLGFIKTQTGSLTNGIYFVSAMMTMGGLAVMLGLPKRATRV